MGPIDDGTDDGVPVVGAGARVGAVGPTVGAAVGPAVIVGAVVGAREVPPVGGWGMGPTVGPAVGGTELVVGCIVGTALDGGAESSPAPELASTSSTKSAIIAIDAPQMATPGAAAYTSTQEEKL